MVVRLREVPGDDPGAEHRFAVVRDVLAGGEPQEMALAAPVRPDDADAFAEPDLRLERIEHPVDRQIAHGERAARGLSASRRIRMFWSCGSSGMAFSASYRLSRDSAAFARDANLSHSAARRLNSFMIADQPLVLLAPPVVLAVEVREPRLPRVVVRRERRGMRPRAVPFERDDRVRRLGEELSIMADVQDGLVRPVSALRASVSRDVEEVVGLVEQQDVGIGTQQRFEREPLLLAARQLAHEPVTGDLHRLAERLRRAVVPQHFGVVAADVSPGGERIRVPDVGRLPWGSRTASSARERVQRRLDRCGASVTRRSRTVVVPPSDPIICGM